MVHQIRKGKEVMKAQKHRRLLSILTIVLTLPVLRAQKGPGTPAGNQKPAFGAIVGVVRNAAKAPVAGATVTAARVDGTGLRATISGSDGLYSFADVVPGEYSLSSQADGYLDTAVSRIEVAGGRAARNDIAIATSTPAQPAVISSNSTTPSSNPPAVSATQATGRNNAAQSMWSRRLRDLAMPAKREPATTASLATPPVAAFDRPEVAQNGAFPAPATAPASTSPDWSAPVSVMPAVSVNTNAMALTGPPVKSGQTRRTGPPVHSSSQHRHRRFWQSHQVLKRWQPAKGHPCPLAGCPAALPDPGRANSRH